MFFAEKKPVFPQKTAFLFLKGGILDPQRWHLWTLKLRVLKVKATCFTSETCVFWSSEVIICHSGHVEWNFPVMFFAWRYDIIISFLCGKMSFCGVLASL